MNQPDTAKTWYTHRIAGILFVLIPVVLVGTLLRVALAISVWNDLASDGSLPLAFVVGLSQDILYTAYAVMPMLLYLVVIPERLFHSKVHRIVTALFFTFVWWMVLFTTVAEWIFWEEFGVRFNFIAVDYLIYTTEVTNNILESYPVLAILSCITVVAFLTNYLAYRSSLYQRWQAAVTPFKSRISVALGAFLVPVLAMAFLSQQDIQFFDNRYDQEIAKNGAYSFFAAFRNNDLPYRDFYISMDEKEAESRATRMVLQQNSEFTPTTTHPLHRHIAVDKSEIRPNVIQITVESLSAEYLGYFGNTKGLTPNLDRLATQSLTFTNFKATGTRTVRGMESLTLSIPPTPGRSIVKRPDNENLFTIGSVFREKGYQTSFLYGGRGYFDNMNAFFAGNGFTIHDQSSEPDEGVEFTNAWGVSDEDLYKWVLAEADKSAAEGKPFFHFVMTTSNHRPYTFPDNRIDLPSHSGRAAAVKYTDYAIGQFIEKARSKPWFDNTIIVIVADHCAGSAGKTDLPVENYAIPLFIYAPSIIKPRIINTLSSQIDYAPTLLALMNWSYDSVFYGKNILAMKEDEGRALLGTYQSLGLYRNQHLTVLKPVKQAEAYTYNEKTGAQTRTAMIMDDEMDAISLYQTAADEILKMIKI